MTEPDSKFAASGSLPPQDFPPGVDLDRIEDRHFQFQEERRKARNRSIIKWVVIVDILALLFVGCLAIPIQTSGGHEAKSSEARAALGTIKDRLRTKYIQNDNVVNTSWTLSDLVNTSELRGKYYGAADYSLVSLNTTGAVLRAAANTTTSAPQVTLTITNIASGTATITSP